MRRSVEREGLDAMNVMNAVVLEYLPVAELPEVSELPASGFDGFTRREA